MRNILKDTWRGLLFGLKLGSFMVLISLGSSWFAVNTIKSWCVYQVHDHRIEWAWCVRVPGREQFYNHYTNEIDSRFALYTKYRISPWFDSGRSTTPIDNDVLDKGRL